MPTRTVSLPDERDDEQQEQTTRSTELIEPEQDEMQRIRALLSNGDNLRIRVYRGNPRAGGGMEFCEEMTAAAFDDANVLNELRTNWGAGKFEFRLIGPKGVVTRAIHSIAELKTAVHAPAQTEDKTAILLQEMHRQNQELMRGVIEAMRANQPQQQFGMSDLLGMLATAKSLFTSAPTESPMNSLKEMIGLIRGTKEAARELSDEDATERDPLAAAIPAVLDLVKAAQAQQTAPIQPVQLPTQIQPVQLPTQIQPVQIPTPVKPVQTPQVAAMKDISEMTAEELAIHGLFEGFIDLAKQNASAEAGAQYLNAVVPDEFMPYLANKFWFEMLKARFPQYPFAEHEQWIRAAKKAFDEMPEDDSDGTSN